MSFPINYHPTWDIRDSSKLDDFIACNRYYLLCHIFGWRMDQPAHDLHFGQCYHYAREHQLLHGYEDVAGAYEKFLDPYREEFEPETDAIYLPKTPTGVLKALTTFRDERSLDLVENEVVEIDGVKMTEISGTVPVDDKRILYYRMDTIMRRKADEKIFSWDHKTTSEKYIIGRQWSESFHLGIQNGTYTHCLYCMFPIDKVLGIEFCGTGFNYLKKGSKDRSAGYYATLKRVTAFKTPDQMNTWLWTVNNILDDIDREMDRLMHCSEDDTVLMAFPMNHHHCSSYRGCQFHDYCLSWQNPLQYAYEPPIGFKEDFWNPAKKPATVHKNLEWK